MAKTAQRPLWLGSIKSNMGHTQAAAGVAGVIKMIEAMRHEVLPATLHVDSPTPHVDWSAGQVRLLTEAQPWTPGARTRRAAVSSFGISGTNAHLILEEAPAPEPAPAPETNGDSPAGVLVLVVSAKSEAALGGQAARLGSYLEAHPQLDLADVGFSLATGRAGLEYRGAVVGSDREELVAGLSALANGQPGAGVVTGRVAGGKTAFVFPGQGAQRAGMGAELYRSYRVFAEAIDAVCAEFDAHLDRSLEGVLVRAGGFTGCGAA